MAGTIPIAVAQGDGIGPEIMQATLHVLEEAGANLEIHPIEIGERVYNRGIATGIEDSAWDTIRNTQAFLKAPVTTPQGGGFKSLNVTVRTTMGLYANVRPCISYAPFIKTKHPKMDLVIIRENEEDLYAGIEYRQTPHVCQSLKIISREGSSRTIRFAFEYARHHHRKKVTCFSKDNIMKFTDGLFHSVFRQIGEEFPEIQKEHWIVDIGAAKLSDTPENFDLLVLPNLYGDILSDVAAQISGSVGLAGSANIGDHGAMFEAIHGSAPRRARQDLANPSGLLLAAVMMLAYLGEGAAAERIHNAWLVTIEKGFHTYDIFNETSSKVKVGTKAFAEAVAKHLGEQPTTLAPALYTAQQKLIALHPPHYETTETRTLVGVDIFVYLPARAEQAIKEFTAIKGGALHLSMITNRGARIWPQGHPETFCIEQWRLRFAHADLCAVTPREALAMVQQVVELGYDVIKTENLYLFDGTAGFSSAQG